MSTSFFVNMRLPTCRFLLFFYACPLTTKEYVHLVAVVTHFFHLRICYFAIKLGVSQLEILIARNGHYLRYAYAVLVPKVGKVVHGQSSWFLRLIIRVFI